MIATRRHKAAVMHDPQIQNLNIPKNIAQTNEFASNDSLIPALDLETAKSNSNVVKFQKQNDTDNFTFATPNGRRNRSSSASNTRSKSQSLNNKTVLTANINQLNYWFGCLNIPCLYEVMGNIVAIYNKDSTEYSSPINELILILRDRKRKGPTIQVIYSQFSYPKLTNPEPGTIVKCTGRMIENRIMRAYKISTVSVDDEINMDRICHVCKHIVNEKYPPLSST